MPQEAFSEQEGSSFVDWLLRRVIVDGRGDEYRRLEVRPEGRFWLGRLTPEAIVQTSRLGQRAERLDPCEVGIRVRPSAVDGRRITCRATLSIWVQEEPEQIGGPKEWRKRGPVEVEVVMATPTEVGPVVAAGRGEIEAMLNRLGAQGYAAEIHVELEDGKDGPELIITLVNVSPGADPDAEHTIYEAALVVQCGETQAFTLDDLPDSFRFDRHVPAYGINCGVDITGPGTFVTNDIVKAGRRRPEYWDATTLGAVPDLSFETLARDPLPSLRAISTGMRTWGERYWSDPELEQRRVSEQWSTEMLAEARRVREEFRQEHQRIDRGIAFLDGNVSALRSFKLMNRAFSRAVSYPAWRPFQLGFVLAVLPCVEPTSPSADLDVVDTLWFATGGGKTETYIGLVATAAFYDRLRGKLRGVTSWARFPLRMLSLQQTQRFANIFAAAELVRREERLEGDPFSIGFLVGSGPSGTPNSLPLDPRPGEPDHRDAEMVAGWKILSSCPFCRSNAIEMRFDTVRWMLNHHCTNADCAWDGPLPFRIVDEEVFRYLPTIVIGTLDKAALVSLKAAMRGLYGPPLGQCSTPGHGFTYARRSKAPEGCEVPNCRGRSGPLQQAPELFGPSIRIQDELHLLRDSLGAIDAHYEALLDHLQAQTGPTAKIIASSATIAGHEHQVDVLYRRRGRLFPASGPWAHRSFWSQDGDRMTRAYVGLAPRGITLDYATDRANESLQKAVRRALAEPDAVAVEAGVRREALPALANVYGVGVVYGSTLKDVEAAARSFDSQISFPVNSVMLIGRTPLNDVRSALQRLVEPETEFEQRIHLVAASSMLSHGVDVDRLNTMVMLGLPLSTAEFIQTTARIGRKHPGLVLVLHKIGRERDAKVFRSFRQFVEHAERLVDPVPITRRSRRVLELTFPGLLQGRLYGVHEPRALAAGLGPLTMPASLRKAFQRLPVIEEAELQELIRMLGADRSQLDEGIRQELTELVRGFYLSMNNPGTVAKWISDLFRTPPMRSLRDVEDQVPVETEGMRR